MAFDADSLGLKAGPIALLRDLIRDRLGLHYADDRLDTLADRLAPLVAERDFGSFLDYFYLLKYDPSSDHEWDRVMDTLSVGETYFWREVDQMHAVVSRVLPQLAEQSDGPLKFWSVPCASGEEPLTLAMLLQSAGWFERVRIEIHAGDASPAALARARAGRYRERAFRSLPIAYRDRYFRRCGDTWQVDPELQARVRWQRINLMDERDAVQVGSAHVVFCRNVFIYFSDDGVRRVVRCLADAMPVPGYLCVGASESLLRVSTRFDLEEMDGAFVYVKRGFPTKGHR
jgi:chemotaxis protein methyltransferase CheR